MNITSHLTHSRMMTYEQCPKKYWYEYVLKLTPEPQYPQYGELGSRAHKVLEDFYNHVTIPCNPDDEFDNLIGRLYSHEFSDIEDYKKNMIGGLINFLEMEIKRYHSLDNKEMFVPKYNELYIKSEIAGILFSGRIDAIYKNEDESLNVVDYKFTSSNSIGNDQKQQAAIYCILLKNELGIEFDEFEFWFLRHKRKTIKNVKITDKLISDVNKKCLRTMRLINDMEFSRKSSYLCRYCGYEGLCNEENSKLLR